MRVCSEAQCGHGFDRTPPAFLTGQMSNRAGGSRIRQGVGDGVSTTGGPLESTAEQKYIASIQSRTDLDQLGDQELRELAANVEACG